MKNLFVVLAVAITCMAVAQETAPTTEPTSGTSGMNTTFGPNGLINIPNAFTARQGEIRLGGTWGRDLRGPSVNYGLFKWFEVGVAGLDFDGSDDKAIISGKVTLLPRNFDRLSVGVGFIDPFDAVNSTFYFVASVDVTPPRISAPTDGSMAVGMRLHLGAGTGLYKDDLFAGAEVLFSDRFSLVGEWDSRNVNAALRFKSNNDVQVQGGVRDKRLFFGITTSLTF